MCTAIMIGWNLLDPVTPLIADWVQALHGRSARVTRPYPCKKKVGHIQPFPGQLSARYGISRRLGR